MPASRRKFLSLATLAGAGFALPAAKIFAGEKAPVSPPKPFKLGIATYSYWHFTKERTLIETCIDKTAALGVEGVDVLHRQMDDEGKDNAYLQKLKRRAFCAGVDLMCLSMHQNFISPDADRRNRQIQHTLDCIEIAYRLGIPCMRINAGTWNTSKDFNELMANRGIEKIPAGITEDDGFKWAIDGIEKCLPAAEKCGVLLALENHWGLSGTPEGMLRILNSVKSPWLRLLADTGNFLEEPYDKLEKIFPEACYVQAKTYFGGGEWYSLDLDYKKIFRQLRAAGYAGYVGIEFEGKAPADEGVFKSVQLMREAMA